MVWVTVLLSLRDVPGFEPEIGRKLVACEQLPCHSVKKIEDLPYRRRRTNRNSWGRRRLLKAFRIEYDKSREALFDEACIIVVVIVDVSVASPEQRKTRISCNLYSAAHDFGCITKVYCVSSTSYAVTSGPKSYSLNSIECYNVVFSFQRLTF